MVCWLTGSIAAAAAPELVFAARTHPAGAAVLAAWYGTARAGAHDRTEVGGALDVYFYWYEADLRARETVLGGLVVLGASAGLEPGFFLLDSAREGPRAFALHPIARGQVELNLRDDRFWLYGRSNLTVRGHRQREWDPYRFRVFEGPEATAENAVAWMVSPSGPAKRKIWFYTEFIAVDSLGFGVLDRNVRLGVIGEHLTPSLAIDVDGYYSFMENGLGGAGLLGLLFWSPGGQP